MNRLRRFYEKVPYGQTSSRVAYATSTAALSKSLPDGEWAEDTKFNAGEAILADPTLKDVYKDNSQRLRYCERAMTDKNALSSAMTLTLRAASHRVRCTAAK